MIKCHVTVKTKMSRLYDSIEPSVIDEALLRKSIEEQSPDGEAGKIAKQEGIGFKEVFELKLSYKSNHVCCYRNHLIMAHQLLHRHSTNGEFMVRREFDQITT